MFRWLYGKIWKRLTKESLYPSIEDLPRDCTRCDRPKIAYECGCCPTMCWVCWEEWKSGVSDFKDFGVWFEKTKQLARDKAAMGLESLDFYSKL